MTRSPRSKLFVKFRKRHFEGNEENIPEPTGWDSGIGFQKMEEIFSIHKYEISFVKNVGGFGGQKNSVQKNKR